MPVDPDSQDAKAIRQLIPLTRIAISRFHELCDLIQVEDMESGHFLFKRGGGVDAMFFILQGSVSLQTEEYKVETIEAKSESAKFPIAHQVPRKIDALAETDIRYLRLDRELIKSDDENHGQENNIPMVEEEIEENDDWMTTLLKSPIFRALPPANLQRILIELEAIKVEAGSNIIEQGDEGDFYYLIKSGRCEITRKPSPTAKEIKLAELKNQDTFGEDALLSGLPRNVTVKALTDVALLRLNKDSFITLIKEPSLNFIDMDLAHQKMSKGDVLLDVRAVDEFKKGHLENSVNVPFFSLRMYLKTFNKSQSVIVVCDDGSTSEAAAFLLLRNKIEAFILQGGLDHLAKASVDSSGNDSVEAMEQPGAAFAPEVVEEGQTESSAVQLAIDSGEAGEQNIAGLKSRVAELEEKCARLASEKEELMKKYKMLFKQMEKMKSVLDAFRGDKK